MRAVVWRKAAGVGVTLLIAACDRGGPVVPIEDHTGAWLAPVVEAPAQFQSTESAEKRYIVRFRDAVPDPSSLADQLMQGRGGRLIHRYSRVMKGFYGELPPQVVEAMRRNPNVEVLIEDVRGARPDGSESTQSWALDRIDQRYLPTDFVYNYAYTGAGANIYILDSGINPHAEFGNRLHAAWTFDSSYPALQDCNGHGTHVASTASGATTGPARGAEIYSVRINDCNGWAWPGDITAAFDWLAVNHIPPAVANLSYSLGHWLDELLKGSVEEAAKRLREEGVVVTVSAGNGNENACGVSPARAAQLITVGSTDSNDHRSAFSNYGNCLDLYAPGGNVRVAYYLGGYSFASGTSFSAPLTAGVVALLIDQYPTMQADELETILMAGGSYDKVIDAQAWGKPLLYSLLPSALNMRGIDGPTVVHPEDGCVWYVDVVGGRPPYTYLWSGVGSGTSPSVGINNPSTGDLRIQVWDQEGRYGSDAIWIEVDPDLEEPVCGW